MLILTENHLNIWALQMKGFVMYQWFPATLIIYMSGCFAYHISTFLTMPESCASIERWRLTLNNCLEACGKNQWNEIGATVHNGIRGYLVRCSWCSDSPSSSVRFRHSSLARAACCRSCSKRCSLCLNSNVNFSISLGREKTGGGIRIKYTHLNSKRSHFCPCREF